MVLPISETGEKRAISLRRLMMHRCMRHWSGVLRGILRDGLPVPEHFKIADIDPRLSERENCFTISDKASAIAGGVLRAICIYENELRSGEGRK